MPQLVLSFLGCFHVEVDGAPVTQFRSDKIRALLAYLALESDRPHRREALAGLLWPDQADQAARDNLRLALLRLRRALGDDAGAAGPILLPATLTIAFNRQSDHMLDVLEFRQLLAACESHAHRQAESCSSCARRMAQAMELYRGPLLEGLFVDSQPFEEWLLVQREMLHAQAVATLYSLAAYHTHRGNYPQAERYARWQLAFEPWREEAHCQLICILALSGQRSAALAQYDVCRHILADELNTEPCDEVRALYHQIQAGIPIETSTWHGGANTKLPAALTPFVGRANELAQIGDLLEDINCRLLTILGPGGIGKTRLALQAANTQSNAFKHGVYSVAAEAMESAAHLVPAIGEAIGFSFAPSVSPQAQLLEYLREKEILLVFDGFEGLLHGHKLAETAQFISALLSGTHHLTLLITSRQWLNLKAEQILRVDGLTRADALLLFEEHARHVQPDFSLSEAVLPIVMEICTLLQGMPLAIELAAAWTRSLPCEAILQWLRQDLSLLESSQPDVPSRQHSLHATFERSWDLLTERERQIFSCLGIFQGRFSPAAATVVAETDLKALSRLVDCSLLRFHLSNEYELHNLLAQYAAEKLRQVQSAYAAAADRHCTHYAAFLQARQACLQGSCANPQDNTGQVKALAEIGQQITQLRAAWAYASQHQRVGALADMLAALFHFYDMRSFFQEGCDAFGMAAEHLADLYNPEAELLYAQALARQGWFTFHLGDAESASERIQRALALARNLAQTSEVIFCLNYLGAIMRHQGHYAQARHHLQEALSLAQKVNDRFNQSIALNILGQITYMEADYMTAQALCQQGLALKRAIGDHWGMVFSLMYLGLVAVALGERLEAGKHFSESLEICRAIGDRRGMANNLLNLGDIAAANGDLAGAQLNYKKSLALFREIGARQESASCLQRLGMLA